MTILIEYIWVAIAAAGLLGFLVSWVLRGMMLAGKKRRATVERDVALTELEQVRGELDSLYAAQRKQKESAATSTLAGGEEQGANLARMSAELEAAKAELAALKSSREAQAPEDQAPVEADASDLVSRNQYLEERVWDLESQIHEMGSADKPADAESDEAPNGDESKLEWQVDYLKMRVASLEEKLIEAGDAQAQYASAPPPQNAAADEELARLRWRNRYLEGRLAYFEEAPEATDDDETARDVSPAPELVPDLSPDETDAGEHVAEADGPGFEAGAGQAEDQEEHPAERMLRALGPDTSDDADDNMADDDAEADTSETDMSESAGDDVSGSDASGSDAGTDDELPEAPQAKDKPDGDADDLTLITGIGPRIQRILNDFGVWHFSQVADWSPANEAWVDRELNLAGRVSREGWVHQARELADADSELASGS